jgi:uracil-DNA glycosylase family 4
MLTTAGYKIAARLKIGDQLIASDLEYEQNQWIKKGQKRRDINLKGNCGFKAGKNNPCYIDGRTLLLDEAREQAKVRSNESCEHCGKKGTKKHELEFAHIDPLSSFEYDYSKYNSSDNGLLLCNSCHKKFDYAKGERKKRYSKGYPTYTDRIISIRIGTALEDVYDIEMETESHNLIANGLVSHNSHAVEYSLISYWQGYLKVHYTPEYFASILTYGDDGKKEDLIPEAKRLGLEITLPNINKSGITTWEIDGDNNLLIPLIEIKGLGEKAAEEIERARKKLNRPIIDLQDLMTKIDKRVVNSKIQRLLEETYCFQENDEIELSEQELEQLSKLFNFSLSNDPMYKYRGILAEINKHVPLKNLKSADVGDFTLCYTKKITFQIKGDKDKTTYSGCYALVTDDDGDYMMANFDRDLYKAKKDIIEHSGEKWVVLRVQSIKPDSIMVNEILFLDDFMKGNFEGLGIYNQGELKKPKLLQRRQIDIQNAMETFDDRLANCNRCELRQECSSPVYPSSGEFNALILGEAPGRNEDKKGLGFIGDAGDVLWYGRDAINAIGLSHFNIERPNIYVSNVLKCWPSVSKIKMKHINTCGIWWKKEIEIIKPFVVLAFGNTGLKAIRGQQSGIMTESGVVEWRDDFNCFVVYCLHPAAILYEPSNAEIYNKGILSFANVYLNAGFGW